MNIQLRNSQSLQNALLAAEAARRGTTKANLAKAQLHPELTDGIVECDREGFTIRSEVLSGFHRGEANEIDARNLKDFLPTSDSCKAEWKIATLKQGDAFVRLPSELNFTFDNGGVLSLRTQAVTDVTKLTSALPSDQSARFDAVREDGKIILKRSSSERALPSTNSSEADLREAAAQAGVKWDKQASLETMRKRISAAEKTPVAV